MDPLVRFKDAHSKGIIPDDVYDLVLTRFHIVLSGIGRIEKASGIQYPVAYVDPSLVISSPNPNSFEYGILFARTIPIMFEEKFQVVIQISAPLIAYGLKGTIHAILAHEFLHFLDLMRKISKMELISDEISGNLFENVYSDETRLFEPRVVFKDRTLLHHITKKFPAGFRDYKLEDKVMKFWAGKDLPKSNISLDTNTVKLSAESLSKIKLDPAFILKIQQLEEKSIKIHKKRLY
ncbi:hypothetical protein BD31_I1677 [Candidatus Nitrosopumilus salaria BD31]|uniref:Uncharacterized protein n=1 Tax=Candidatus Nitrosopumilus salarius BD31 TaxID=859350 RepID=I3D3J7_9ARCH|nr:hypothetical protein [Candidatus Nitrosopumilus salaria]EIJ66290.1 hypothetical protein BD31_I1677 [Candidatus Nitrosopumilus salaria BD31]